MPSIAPISGAPISALLDDEFGYGSYGVGAATLLTAALGFSASVGTAELAVTAAAMPGTNAVIHVTATGLSASVGQATLVVTATGSPVGSYPAFAQLTGTVPPLADDIKSDYATTGALRQRAMYPAAKRDFPLRHILTGAEIVELRQFYAINRTARFALIWQGTSYNVKFSKPIRETLDDGAWRVEVDLKEV